MTASIRELGRTRIEVVPRDSQSVFVYWEVADTAPQGPPPTSIQLRIDLVREKDDEVGRSFETNERVGGEIVEVDRTHRYYAVLNLLQPQQYRLARSSTIAGVLQSGEHAFVSVDVTESGLKTEQAPAPSDHVEWTWQDEDSSSR